MEKFFQIRIYQKQNNFLTIFEFKINLFLGISQSFSDIFPLFTLHGTAALAIVDSYITQTPKKEIC